jgi:hypothetical protein
MMQLGQKNAKKTVEMVMSRSVKSRSLTLFAGPARPERV